MGRPPIKGERAGKPAMVLCYAIPRVKVFDIPKCMPDLLFYKKGCIPWLFCLFTSVYAVGQQADSTFMYRELSNVEVIEKARPSVSAEGAPLQLLERESIERLGLQNLSEAVNRFSGVHVKNYGGIGGLKTVSIRSLGSHHTAVSYDGVTISDAQNGQIDISRFSLDNVEAVSLSIGQTNDIFQTARMYASAGALSIRTSAPDFAQKQILLQAKVRAGSFGLVNPFLRYGQKINNDWSFTADGDWLRADGDYAFTLVNGDLAENKKRKNSDIETWRGELNIHGNLHHSGKLSVKGYYFDSERGLPGSIILYNDYTGERLWDKNAFVQAHYENRFNDKLALKGQLKYNYAWTKYVIIDNKYESGRQEDRYTQSEYYASVAGLYSPLTNVSFSLTEDFFVNTLDNTLPNCPYPERYTSLTVVAAQYKDSRLTLTGSALGTYITEKVESGNKPADRKRLSPSVSITWRVLPEQNLRVRASFKDIFRVPTFNDLYYLRMGNTNLKNERTSQYNIGLTWSERLSESIPMLMVSVDGYYNTVRDKIIAVPTMFVWKMRNLGKVDIKGLDVNVSTQLSIHEKTDLLLQGSYTFQEALDITDESEKSYKHQIPYTPKHTGNASLSIMHPWVNITYSLTAVGNRYALSQNIEDNLIKKYLDHGIAVNRDFKLKNISLRLQAEVLNLTDSNYEVIKFYPMPGRSWRLSLNINY